MGVSFERCERVLRQGMAAILRHVEQLATGEVQDRARESETAWSSVTWCYQKAGMLRALRETVATDTFIVLVPESERVDVPASMWTNRDENTGSVRVFVRTEAMTPRWAGLGLFHELSHVVDYHDAVDIDTSTRAYVASEARAFRMEMVAYDRLSDGRLSAALAQIGPLSVPPGELRDEQRSVIRELELRARLSGPGHASDGELALRDAFYAAALVLATAWQEPDPSLVVDPERSPDLLAQLLSKDLDSN